MVVSAKFSVGKYNFIANSQTLESTTSSEIQNRIAHVQGRRNHKRGKSWLPFILPMEQGDAYMSITL